MEFAAEPLDALHAVTMMPVPASLALDSEEEITVGITLGDSAVFSLQLSSGDSIKTWFIRATVVDSDPQARGTGSLVFGEERVEFTLRGAARFHVQVTDATGTLISESVTSRLVSESLCVGLAPACAFGLALRSSSEDEKMAAWSRLSIDKKKAYCLSLVTVNNVIKIVEKNESLGPLLREVVRSPSWLSVAFNFAKGIRVQFNLEGPRVWKHATPIEAEAAFVMRVGVVAFGQPALEASMVVVQSKVPIHPCAGVVSIVGVHPDKRDVRVHLQLQALGRVGVVELARLVVFVGTNSGS